MKWHFIFAKQIKNKKKMQMKRNLSGLNRIIRLIIAVVSAILYFTGIVSGVLGIVLLAVAIIMLTTSVAGYCPLKLLTSSCPFRPKKEKL
jgi:membrane protein YdbS with pleckstrin-like domain